ncbi:MAG TPA: xanthine dehydrogenase family protein subunit M [Bacteroidales bacterium]|nr:xanthine dehydrogenase family protein subunit M [Bacteroidales bacterium]
MPIPYDFQYVKPATLNEALEFLGKHGAKSRILAGGTDIVNELKMGFRVPEALIDIKGLTDLSRIEIIDGHLQLGALVTFNDLRGSKLVREHAYTLYEAAGLVASGGVRNRATMVGNICSAVACLDSATPLMVHDAAVKLQSIGITRSLLIQNWFVDNRKTAIAPNELVTHVSIPLPGKKYGSAYQKMMRYSGEDLSQANVAVLLYADGDCRVAFGSVGPIPKRSPKIENQLRTQGLSPISIAEAKEMIEQVIAPITDQRATREYRMHMTKVMFERAIATAADRLKAPKLITKL